MMRTASTLAAVALLGGCTADFYVGPEMTGTSGGMTAPTSDAPTGPPPTTGATSETTTDATTQSPTTTQTGDASTGTRGSAETTDSNPGTTTGAVETTASDTVMPADCELEALGCEEAFPECLWNGEVCSVNECHVLGGELDCLDLAPECIWEGGGCIPGPCASEMECSTLELGFCAKTPGCIELVEQCYSLECAPCQDVDMPSVCMELPNCTYNEGRAACLPL